VGSFAVEALARSGIATLTLVDGDIVTLSNLNRQLLALHSTLGELKTAVAARRLAAINPACQVTTISDWVTPANAVSFLDGSLAPTPHWLVDAIDDLPAKAALLAAAVTLGVKVVSVLGTGNRISPLAQFTVTDISQSHTCPVARALRRRLLRDYGLNSGITVVFSPLPPLPANPQREENSRVGSVSYIPGQAGLIAAGVVITALAAEG